MKFSKDSYWLKSGIYSLLQNASTLIFGFGGFYFLVRILDKNQFGSWSLFVTVTTILEVARGGFVKYGFVKFSGGADKEDQKKIFTASLFLNSLFALSASIILFFLGSYLAHIWKTPELRQMFIIYSVTSLVLIPFFQLEYLQQSLMDFKRIFFAYFVRSGFLFFAILFGYLGFYKIDLMLLVILNLTGAALASLSFYLIIRKPILFSPTIDWPMVRKLVDFGKYVLGTNLGASLYGAVDQFILGSLVSTASVAVYSVSSRITNLVNTPSVALSVIVFPQSVKVIHTEGRAGVKALYEKSVAVILGIVLPGVIMVVFFSTFIVTKIAGVEYLDAVPILQISIFVSCFLPFGHQFGVTLDAIGFPHVNFYFTISLCVINLTLDYFLISSYGIVGAALGTLTTTILGFISMQLLLRRMIGVEIVSIFKNLIGFYIDMSRILKNFILKK